MSAHVLLIILNEFGKKSFIHEHSSKIWIKYNVN